MNECRRRILVEDDDASVTNFILQDWRHFRCDILYHSSSEHCISFPLFIQMILSSKHPIVCTQLSLFLYTDRQTVGVFSSDKSVSPPVTNHLPLSSSIRSHMRLHTGPLPMTIRDTCGILKRH